MNDIEAYSQLNENVKLCIELIMHKFDSENLRRTGTGHQHSNYSAPSAAIAELNYNSITESQGRE